MKLLYIIAVLNHTVFSTNSSVVTHENLQIGNLSIQNFEINKNLNYDG